jgi:uncharacterized YccA/Bax inhibitor family protein
MAVFSAMMALGILYLGTFLIGFFNPSISAAVFGPGPLGVVIAAIAVGIASLNLPIQFDQVERTASNGAPSYMQWYAAFGLMLGIIWLYVSLLRLLALTRR